jgi:hypothetical protein
MNLYFTLFNIMLLAFVIFAIMRCCVSCQGPLDNSATQTTDQTQNPETADSGTLPQHQTTARCDGMDPALLRSKVIQSIFPGQTVRASVDFYCCLAVSVSGALFVSQNITCRIAQQSLLTHSVLFCLFLIRLMITRLSCTTLKPIPTIGPTIRLAMHHARFA